jgi:hypothetical protein
LRILRDKEFCSNVHRKRYQDRLNRAFGQADVGGLRVARPAGFALEIPPRVGDPNYVAALAPLEWKKLERDETPVPLPMRIPQALGKSFRPLSSEPRPPDAGGRPWAPEDTQVKLRVAAPDVRFELAAEFPPIAAVEAGQTARAPSLDATETCGFVESVPAVAGAALASCLGTALPVPLSGGAVSNSASLLPAPIDLPSTGRAVLEAAAALSVDLPLPGAVEASQSPRSTLLPLAQQAPSNATPSLGIPSIEPVPAATPAFVGAQLVALELPGASDSAALSHTCAFPAAAPENVTACLPAPFETGASGSHFSTAPLAQLAAAVANADAAIWAKAAATAGAMARAIPVDFPISLAPAFRIVSLATDSFRPNETTLAAPFLIKAAPHRLGSATPCLLNSSPLVRELENTIALPSCLNNANRVTIPAAEQFAAVEASAAAGSARFASAFGNRSAAATPVAEIALPAAFEAARSAAVPANIPEFVHVEATLAEGGAPRIASAASTGIAPTALAPSDQSSQSVRLPEAPASAVAGFSIAAFVHVPSTAAALRAGEIEAVLSMRRAPALASSPEFVDLQVAQAALPDESIAACTIPDPQAPSAAPSIYARAVAFPALPLAAVVGLDAAADAGIAFEATGLPDGGALAPLASALPAARGAERGKLVAMPAPVHVSHAAPARSPEFTLQTADEELPDPYNFDENPPCEGDFVALEYFCQRSTVKLAAEPRWIYRKSACAIPAQPFDEVPGKIEDCLPQNEPEKPFFAERPKSTWRKWNVRSIEHIAAAALIATIMGAGYIATRRVGTETPDVRRDAVAVRGAGGPGLQQPPSGPVSHIRNAIAKRAAVEVSDSFQSGMEAWGHVKSLAPGWTRSADGYVTPGQLALFRPSMKFTDYRMQFFGTIESKSIDWVVRARDTNNYYAMKFTVIEKGLRPIIAMVHYPVIAGKAGRRSTIPLNVMVHNNQAYHVDVAVKGTRIITSIEGQEVDRWIEDSVTAGGVGFFSEADERSRLYWMKVAKNEDFLGRVCAFLSGSSSNSNDAAASASLRFSRIPNWNQGIYHGLEFFNPAAYYSEVSYSAAGSASADRD